MTHRAALDNVLHFFEHVSPQSVQEIAKLYEADAYFKDPFNEVRGQANIMHIFEHMFRQVDAPRFIIRQFLLQEADAFIVWDFQFCLRGHQKSHEIHGASHVRFSAAGKVVYHRDYWDAAEELYEKLPVLGSLMRFIKCRVRS
ncbi:nuclear transport factor 2 family protein [Ferrigenium sp. UT5]|uniref:nuclear transport factor 2 family protein n=1 Tax=Ferrigenium sp. UT5 TaxID=3242105 RepID=UPI00354D289E